MLITFDESPITFGSCCTFVAGCSCFPSMKWSLQSLWEWLVSNWDPPFDIHKINSQFVSVWERREIEENKWCAHNSNSDVDFLKECCISIKEWKSWSQHSNIIIPKLNTSHLFS
jgi:hypothetical protein